MLRDEAKTYSSLRKLKGPGASVPAASSVYYRGKLGESLFQEYPEFNLGDPNMHLTDWRYNSLHDPHLKDFFRQADRKRLLIKQGLVTCDEKVLCSRKDFFKYMTYIKHVQQSWEKLLIQRESVQHKMRAQHRLEEPEKEQVSRELLEEPRECHSSLRSSGSPVVMSSTSTSNEISTTEVKLLMKLTFYTQRKEVNQGKDIKYLLEEWPFWFDELGMAVHFKELTRIGLKETFTRNVNLKGKRLLNYMHTVCVNKKKKFLQAVTKFKVMRGELNGCSEDVKEMVLLLLSYFDEKEDAMFCYVDDTCLAGEVQMDQVHLTPTVVVCGQSCYSSRRFMLSVDRNIVHDNIPSFISALCMMFGSYYSFNIHYPSELASTLEFLQRCFFSINPEKGTKVEKTNTSRLHVNPRVITLIQELSDHEWREV